MRASSSALPTKPSIVCATFGPSPISPAERRFFFAWAVWDFVPRDVNRRTAKNALARRDRASQQRVPTSLRSAALELQDVETRIRVGEIHDALRVDVAV